MRLLTVPPLLRHGSLPWLLGAAVSALILAQALAAHHIFPGVCGALTIGSVAPLTKLSLQTTSLQDELMSWALMLTAMMPPLMSSTVNHVLDSSLPKRRLRGTTFVLLAYGAVWLVAGLVLVPLAIIAMVILRGAAFPCFVMLAFVWSSSPLAQRARNACHRVVRIGLVGWNADWDCLRQGLILAPWCVISCWPWMVAAMLSGSWQIASMAAIALFLIIDRLLPPAPARWRMPPAAVFVATTLRA